MPSLKTSASDADWLEGVWADAVAKAADATGLEGVPEDCPWRMAKVMERDSCRSGQSPPGAKRNPGIRPRPAGNAPDIVFID